MTPAISSTTAEVSSFSTDAKTFASKYLVIPLGINATAGAMAGVVLKAPAMTTLTSGVISGALQSVATVPRNWVLNKIDANVKGIAKIVLISATALAIYAVHIPVLMGTSQLLGTPIALKEAFNLTLLGGGFGALEYAAAQHLVDEAAAGKKVSLT